VSHPSRPTMTEHAGRHRPPAIVLFIQLVILLFILSLTGHSSSVLAQAAAAPVPAPAGHPLLGKWRWIKPENKCVEVYDFRADGTVPVVSGDERTENTYTVSADSDQNGFYLLTLKTTKDYGGKDCADDSVDSTGQDGQMFILFEPTKTMYLACAEPKVARCYGPLRKVTE
jgi:hypothetical protein